jgi:IPT/TIG domain-containing protein
LLVKLIADLLTNADVQQQFSREPSGVMDSYGLSQEARQALEDGDRDRLLEMIGQEMSRSALFGALWSKPGGVVINSVSPTTGKAGTQIELTVTGDYFASTAFVTLKQGDGNYLAQTLQVTQPDVQGSTLKARLNLPASAPPGVYAVTVSNPSAWFSILDNSFTVVAK